MSSGPILKILVVGDAGVGKTALIKRYVYDRFEGRAQASLGVSFDVKAVEIDGAEVRLQLWDIAGAETAGSATRAYYRDAFAAVLVYDVSNPATFDTVERWKGELDAALGDAPVPVVLVGNKSDVDAATVDALQLDKYCIAKGFTQWFDASAKSGANVADALECAARAALAGGAVGALAARHGAVYSPAAGAGAGEAGQCW